MQYIYAISATTENTLRVLQRMAGIFARYRLNIEQLNVVEICNKDMSYFNIMVYSDPKTIERVIKQLEKIIELKEVKIESHRLSKAD